MFFVFYKMTELSGPVFSFFVPITKSAFRTICKRLTKKLNDHYSERFPDEFQFILEVTPAMTPGGGFQIHFYDKDSKELIAQYVKVLRIENDCFPADDVSEWRTSWKKNYEVVYPRTGVKHAKRTFIQTSGGAPRWTSDEMKIFIYVFGLFGIRFEKMFPPRCKFELIDNNNKSYKWCIYPFDSYIQDHPRDITYFR